MKKLILILLLLLKISVYSQVTIFSENFGTSSTYTGYQNYGIVTYTGALGGIIPSTTNLSIRIEQTGISSLFKIDDINLSGYQNITDSFISNCMGFMYDSIIYTQDSVYLFNEISWNGCDSFVRIDYMKDLSDPSCILPIELSYFIGKPLDGYIQLSWETLSEFNSDRFEVYKLYDDKWINIGHCDAVGYSNFSELYSISDELPLWLQLL